MIGYLIRLVMGKDTNAFWIGLVMLLVGLGLTVASYTTLLAIGGAGVVVFYGLMIGGVIRMVTAAPSLLSGPRETKRDFGPLFGPRGTPGQVVSGPILPSFMALPTEMSPGQCWQCGGKVKPGRVMCLHCGATLTVPGEPEQSSVAQLAGYDPNISSTAIPNTVRTVTGPPPGYGGPPPQWSPPGMYRRDSNSEEYDSPPPGYDGPPPGYGSPPPGYGGPPPGYGSPPPRRGGPPPGYGGPPPGHGGPPPGYGGRRPRRGGPPPGWDDPRQGGSPDRRRR